MHTGVHSFSLVDSFGRRSHGFPYFAIFCVENRRLTAPATLLMFSCPEKDLIVFLESRRQYLNLLVQAVRMRLPCLLSVCTASQSLLFDYAHPFSINAL